MNRIRGPRETDPTKEWHRYLRALPAGNHFIEVTFRNIRTGESSGRMYALTPGLYETIRERHPLVRTPEEALTLFLGYAMDGRVSPRPGPNHNPDYEPVYDKYRTVYLLGQRGDELAKTKTKLIQDYLVGKFGAGKKGGKTWTKERQELDRTLRRRLKAEFPD